MKQNVFFPIYKQLEKEFIELSYFITFDKRQLSVYSIKIADLILRSVSECENIIKELCKREGIKFYDKNHHVKKIIYFQEYFEKLDVLYNLSDKFVSVCLDNCAPDTFDEKLVPFRKDIEVKNGASIRKIWSWYNAYNKIKHDRVKNFKQANINNLVLSLAALFLLNVYYRDQKFYSVDNHDIEPIEAQIKGFSNVFEVDFALDVSNMVTKEDTYNDTFFHPLTYWQVARNSSTYILYYDKQIKTDADNGADLMDKLESSVYIRAEDGTLKRKYDCYKFTDHTTKCALVALINKLY